MKRIFLVLIVFIMGSIMVAESVETSNIAAFDSNKGSLIIKEYHSIASVKGLYSGKLNMDVLFMQDATTNRTISGLRMEAEETKSYGASSSRSLLDVEEVESLISALDYLIQAKTKYGTDKQQPYRELEYSSKDSFKFGVFISKAEYTVFSTVGRIGSTTIFLKYDQLPQIKQHLVSALAKLKE